MSRGAIKRLNAAVQSLSYKYRTGAIVYPRTASDYKRWEGSTTLSPHPPLGDCGDFSGSMFFDSYPLSKETLPLALANEGISTPATIPGIMSWVDKYYDDDLNRRPSLSAEITLALSKMEKMEAILAERFHDKSGENSLLPFIGKESVPLGEHREIFFFSIPLAPSPEREEAIKKEEEESYHIYRSWRKENFPPYKQTVVSSSSFLEAVEVFRQTAFLEDYVEKAEELLASENKRKDANIASNKRIRYGR